MRHFFVLNTGRFLAYLHILGNHNVTELRIEVGKAPSPPEQKWRSLKQEGKGGITVS